MMEDDTYTIGTFESISITQLINFGDHPIYEKMRRMKQSGRLELFERFDFDHLNKHIFPKIMREKIVVLFSRQFAGQALSHDLLKTKQISKPNHQKKYVREKLRQTIIYFFGKVMDIVKSTI